MLKRPIVSLGVSTGLLFGLVSAWAANSSPRQYYGHYRFYKPANYFYRPYYYKPSLAYSGYKHHYTVYYPSRSKYQYFYNPYKKVYWGRIPAKAYGKPQYSLLAEKDRKARVEEIEESAFPPMGPMPPIPESEDGEKMELPPDDLPGTETLPR